MNSSSPIVKHLVLIGGGHSHLTVMKRLGMNPVPGLAVTLITKDVVTPYSGSMPAYIAGHYNFDAMHIDLRPLAQFAGIRLIQANVENINLNDKSITLDCRPDITFDLLSLNIGSRPNGELIKGSEKYGIPVKPIDTFLKTWDSIFKDAIKAAQSDKPFTLAIVGGGPASVELALAAQYKIHTDLGISLGEKSCVTFKIISNTNSVLNFHNQKAQSAVAMELKRRQIEVVLNTQVTEFKKKQIVCEEADAIDADRLIYATGASIPTWPKDIGLKTSSDGFIEVNQQLQSTSHDFVFAAGDAATIVGHPRPKSGVYAVRQGKPLAENLIRYATKRSLVTHTPQREALALINLGDKNALAMRGNLFFQGKSVWRLKDWIDSSFVEKYSDLPVMKESFELSSGLVDKATEKEFRNHAMRCAGCGAKVSGSMLHEVLNSLPRVVKDDVITSRSDVEDASQIDLGGQRVLLQSVDQISSFINDPWLFAKIATNHCLSDIYAMGVEPHSAQAIVSLPHAESSFMKEQLSEIMLGCAETLQKNDCALIGGHSSESNEIHFGLSVNGFSEGAILEKGNLQKGDVLILSKALGTGTLLAADMRYKAKHSWMKTAIESMLLSNRAACQVFVDHKVNACTDVTGFGLAGHLLEMLESKSAKAELYTDKLPILPGAIECLGDGIISSLHKENAKTLSCISGYTQTPAAEIVFDPQTSGGLLASVSADKAESCINALIEAGHNDAAIIGQVLEINSTEAEFHLK